MKKYNRHESKQQPRAFCIDLNCARPEVMEFSGEELQADLDYEGTSNPVELSDYERRVFKTAKEAEGWLKVYLKTLRSLPRLTSRKRESSSSSIPGMLLKRRYLVLTAMGIKKQTYRHYTRDWKSGQLFNFYDQTYYLTVRLKKITQTGRNEYEYSFELV